MNAGSTITSRDSHDVRHIAAARHARSGRPRWKNDATRPAARSAQDSDGAGDEEPRRRGRRSDRTARELGGVQREEQALAGADQRGEEDDRECGMHEPKVMSVNDE